MGMSIILDGNKTDYYCSNMLGTGFKVSSDSSHAKLVIIKCVCCCWKAVTARTYRGAQSKRLRNNYPAGPWESSCCSNLDNPFAQGSAQHSNKSSRVFVRRRIPAGLLSVELVGVANYANSYFKCFPISGLIHAWIASVNASPSLSKWTANAFTTRCPGPKLALPYAVRQTTTVSGHRRTTTVWSTISYVAIVCPVVRKSVTWVVWHRPTFGCDHKLWSGWINPKNIYSNL